MADPAPKASNDNEEDDADATAKALAKLIKGGKTKEVQSDDLKASEEAKKIALNKLATAKAEKELRDLEHPHGHSWWHRKTEKLEEKAHYYHAKHEYKAAKGSVSPGIPGWLLFVFVACLGGGLLAAAADGKPDVHARIVQGVVEPANQAAEGLMTLGLCALVVFLAFRFLGGGGKKGGDSGHGASKAPPAKSH